MIKIKDPYGYIYIITNLINGKRYVGKNIFDNKSKWKSYMGSGVFIKKAIKKYGKDNFIKDIILVCYSKEELETAEINVISTLNADNSVDYYNVIRDKDDFKKYKGKRKSGRKINNKKPVYNSSTGLIYDSLHLATVLTGCSNVKQQCERNKRIIENGEMFCINKTKKSMKRKNNVIKGKLKSSNWYYIEDMWKCFNTNCRGVPVIDVNSLMVYPNCEYARRTLGLDDNPNLNKRYIYTLKDYLENEERLRHVTRPYMRVTDYLLLYRTNDEVSSLNNIQNNYIL